MNKYIISPLIISLLVTFHASAMESVHVKPNPSIPCDDVCHLGKMPIDIQNCIKYYVTCDDETDEEFITRIAIESEELVPFTTVLLEFCPDKTKMIKCGYGWNRKIILTMSNVQKNDACEVVYTKKSNVNLFCERVALSSAGDTIAILYHTWLSNPGYLLIRNIHTEQEVLHNVSLPLEVNKIAFNKQGTRLIAYGRNSDTEENMHKMFYLKKVHKNKPEVVVDSSMSQAMEVKENKLQINELQNYFRDKCVCNKLLKDEK
jgi:hypothetical protein